jgi:hypothetical protein
MSLVRRVSRLEEMVPEEPRFLRLHVEVTGEPPLSEAETAVLATQERELLAEAEPGQTVVALWTRERAAELGAPSPPAEETGIQVEIEVLGQGELEQRIATLEDRMGRTGK